MKAIWLSASLQLGVVALLPAQGVETLFPAQPTGMVNDLAGVIDPATAARVETRLTRLRDSTGAEVAVVTLASIGDHAAADVALAIGRSWRVGLDAPVGDRRRNAGVVMLLVPRSEERRGAIQISTGDGVEGIITDARAGRIADAMLPDLRNGDYSAAVDVGTTQLAQILARELGSTDSVLVGSTQENGVPIFLIILIVIIVLAVVIALTSSDSGGPGAGRGSGSGRSGRYRSTGGPIFIPGGFGGGSYRGGGFGGGGFGGFGGGGGFSGGGAGRGF